MAMRGLGVGLAYVAGIASYTVLILNDYYWAAGIIIFLTGCINFSENRNNEN